MPNPTLMAKTNHQGSFRSLRCSSGEQRLMIGFLLLVMFVIGKHDLTASSPYNLAMHMSSDDLAYSVQTGSVQRQIAFVALLAVSILMIVRTRPGVSQPGILRNNLPLACFVGFAILSASWSGDPALTLRRTAEYCILCAGAIAAGRVLGSRGVVWLGFLGSTGYLALGLLAEGVLGTFHPLSLDYRFYGTLYPNEQAWNCILSLITGSTLISRSRGLSRFGFIGVMAIGGVCLMLTKSRTSLVCGVLTLAFYWAERLSRKYILTLLPTATILASVLIGAYLLDSEAAKQLNQTLLAGRDADTYENFSGRVPLWRLCMEYVAVRPVAGYGFYGFWTHRAHTHRLCKRGLGRAGVA